MKKIELHQIKGVKVLTREQLKKITGGDEELDYPSCPGSCGGGDGLPWTAGCHIMVGTICTCKNSLATWSNC